MLKGFNFSSLFSKQKIDVLLLQETHTIPTDEVDQGSCHNFIAGGTVLFRATANMTVPSSTEVVKGRRLIVREEIENYLLCFVNIHASNQGAQRVGV